MTLGPRHAWIDGRVVAWPDARLHIDTQAVLGGLNAYEVVGGFWSAEQEELYFFRFAEHFRRLQESVRVMRLDLQYSDQELLAAAREVVTINGYRRDVRVRIVAYVGSGPIFSHHAAEVPTGVFVFAKPAESGSEGVHVSTSKWVRLSDMAAPPRVKSGANYQNARLAMIQAKVDGYDDAVLLNSAGKVCELPLANIFVTRDGRLSTPSISSGILEGITRRTLIDLAPELGLTIDEREIDRSELLIAEETFSTGSVSGITPILSIDRYTVGDGRPGVVASQVRLHMQELLRGRAGHLEWLSPVYRPA
jgi:branched-chain amino acid aminotransferase